MKSLQFPNFFTTLCHPKKIGKFWFLVTYQEVPAARVHPWCAKAHNCFGLTLGGDETRLGKSILTWYQGL